MSTATPTTPSPEEQRILELLERNSYQQVADAIGCSRGYVHKIVVKFDAFKHRARRHERRDERRARMVEFLKANLSTTVEAEALEFLAHLPDRSVQLHVTSPPYNISKRYDDAAGADAMDHLFYLGWQVQIISEIARTLKPGGTVVYQVGLTIDERGERFPLDELLAPFFRKSGLTYQNRIVWPAQSGLTPKRQKRLAERYETALVFSKGDPVFNPNAIAIPQKQPDKRKDGELSGRPLGAYPIDIWQISRVMHNHPERTGHPAQFPVEFPLRAILGYTMPGDLVVDIFNGSGSTQEAAIRAGRPFIGSDLAYSDLRAKRLADVAMDTVTPFRGVTAESMAVWASEASRASVISNEEDRRLCLDLFGTGEAA